MAYDQTNRGVLFKSKYNGVNNPNWYGTVNVNGEEYDIAMWEQVSTKGAPYMSIKLSPLKAAYSSPIKAETIVTDIPDGEIDLTDIPF